MTPDKQGYSYKGSDRRTDKFFNLSIDLLCIATVDGYFVDVNPAFMKTLGFSKEELTSTTFLEFVHPDDQKVTLKEIEKLAQGKQTLNFENRYRCKNGEYIWLSWKCPAADPQTGWLYAIAHDLTNRKEAELALRQSEKILHEQKKSLEQKNIALQEVLAQIEIEKNQLRQEVIANIDELVFPILQKIKRKGSSIDKKHIRLLEKNLRSITSSFGLKVSKKTLKLTPKEIEICNMIRSGLTSKDIAQMINVSYRTVDNHRNHIRSKLGLAGKDVNLTTYLKNM